MRLSSRGVTYRMRSSRASARVEEVEEVEEEDADIDAEGETDEELTPNVARSEADAAAEDDDEEDEEEIMGAVKGPRSRSVRKARLEEEESSSPNAESGDEGSDNSDVSSDTHENDWEKVNNAAGEEDDAEGDDLGTNRCM